ncbi:MAG: alpha/beta fold hydrolase [Thermoanaerobaculia bacterium]|nr:alpha/beta fold hydrolase [Thermoanaerobaculia bacterium]
MPSILYLHGFASSPRGQKVEQLRALLGPGHELVAPDLNVPSFAKLDFEAVVDHALETARERRPDVIVGSSLGALVTLTVASRGIDSPLVLLAPAFGLGKRWLERLATADDPVTLFNPALGRDAEIHRAFFEGKAAITIEQDPPAAPVTVIMGRKDESVSFDLVASTWDTWERSGRLAAGSRFVEVPDGDHRLVEFTGLIAGEIRRAAEGG